MTRDQLAATWRFLGILGIALTFALSLLPMPDTTLHVEQGDKIVHLVGYAILTAWHAPLARTRGALVAYAVAFVLLGLLIELLQTCVPWRSGNDPWDALSNAIGCAVGAIVSSPFRARLARRLPLPA